MGVVEPGLGVVQLQDAVIVVGSVAFDQVQLPLATFQDGVVGDEAPLVVVGPGLHLAAHRAGEVVCGAQVIHVVVQPDMVAVALGPPGPLLRAGGPAVVAGVCAYSSTQPWG